MTRALIVMEEEGHAADLREALERAGYVCVALCPLGPVRLSELPLAGVEVILCGARVLSVGGGRLCPALLREAPTARVVLVAMSDDQEALEGALEAPPDGLVLEPVARDTLLARVLEARQRPGREVGRLQRQALRDLIESNRALRMENEELALASVGAPRPGPRPRLREELFGALFEQTGDAALVLNPRGLILDLNQSAERLLGKGRQALLGEALLLYRGAEGQSAASFLSRLQGGEPGSLDGASLRAAGEPLSLTAQVVPTLGEARVLLVARPLVSEVVEGDLQREQQALLGAIVSGLAHEISNPVAYVQANLLYLQEHNQLMGVFVERVRELSAQGVTREQLEGLEHRLGLRESLSELDGALLDALGGCQRIGQLVRDMKGVAQLDDEPAVEYSLRSVLQRAIHLASPALRTRARVSYHLDEEYPVLLGHPGKLTHCFLSLLIAVSGHLTEGDAAEHELRVLTRREPGQLYVQVSAQGPALATGSGREAPDTLDGPPERAIFSEALLRACRQTLQAHGGVLLVQLGADQSVTLEATLGLPQEGRRWARSAQLPLEALSSGQILGRGPGGVP
jgi:PAS domain S-box-containing protein